MDDGTEPGLAAEEALRHLGEARDAARALSESLHKAASVLIHMDAAETKA
ncbi:hypothetical protein [Streptomyces sp. XD-27]|nr:hypothetical protein [Streptomyces sp. XD-27]WKX69573.1 hypothetical protein Q3Y56_06305 [Streptomyces sp. XD-27]